MHSVIIPKRSSALIDVLNKILGLDACNKLINSRLNDNERIN